MTTYPYPVCAGWFGHSPTFNVDDCRTALTNLPVNEDPILYRPLRRSRSDPRGLLVVETHHTCELRLHASGQWVEQHEFAINIVPNKIRDLFSDVIEGCSPSQTGGFVADGIQNTIDWIIRKDTEFPGEPPKTPNQPRNIRIPEYATFLTAMMWAPRNPREFEPGANCPVTTTILKRVLGDTAFYTRSKDQAFAEELYHRSEFEREIRRKQWEHEIPYWTWWGDRRRTISGETPLSENGSLALVNATKLQVLDFTSPAPPELDWYGGGNCTAAVNGSCSTSRRQKKKKSKKSKKRKVF